MTVATFRGYVDVGRVNVGAYVEPALKRSIVEIAKNENKSVSEVIRETLAARAEGAHTRP